MKAVVQKLITIEDAYEGYCQLKSILTIMTENADVVHVFKIVKFYLTKTKLIKQNIYSAVVNKNKKLDRLSGQRFLLQL